MMIDTKDVSSWVKTHLAISVPAATGALSWFAAMRWQAALDHNQIALCIFYFSICAVSGVATTILTFVHLNKLGCFGEDR